MIPELVNSLGVLLILLVDVDYLLFVGALNARLVSKGAVESVIIIFGAAVHN